MRKELWPILMLLLAGCIRSGSEPVEEYFLGAIVRGDTTKQEIALVFTGDEFADGGERIRSALKLQEVPGSFFFTGNFYRNPDFQSLIRALASDGHYLGAHSDRHLLYCDWEKRDSLLVTRSSFREDLENNYGEMKRFGVEKRDAPFFLPPYEWYNDSIAAWTREMGLRLINYTPGTPSHTDYTLPGDPAYRSSDQIYRSIIDFEERHPGGLNGFILLTHVGTAAERTDKFYDRLEELIRELISKGYRFRRIDAFFTSGEPG